MLYWDISQAANIWTPSQMWEAWQGFSATLSMFDVNVTTDNARIHVDNGIRNP